MSMSNLLFEILIGLGIAVVAVIEPIIVWFWRKIKIAAAKRKGMYECFIIYPEGGTEMRFLQPKNNAVEWKRGKNEYLGTIPASSAMYSIKEGMPQLILAVSNPSATNINEILNNLAEEEANKLKRLIMDEEGNIKSAATVVQALEIKKRPVDPTMHTLKQQVLAFERMTTDNKRDVLMVMMVIVLLAVIASVALNAFILSSISNLSSTAAAHAVAATPTT